MHLPAQKFSNEISIDKDLFLDIANFMLLVVCEITILYLHYSGLNNICHYWRDRRQSEYERHGETEKMHEVLKLMLIHVLVTYNSMELVAQKESLHYHYKQSSG